VERLLYADRFLLLANPYYTSFDLILDQNPSTCIMFWYDYLHAINENNRHMCWNEMLNIFSFYPVCVPISQYILWSPRLNTLQSGQRVSMFRRTVKLPTLWQMCHENRGRIFFEVSIPLQDNPRTPKNETSQTSEHHIPSLHYALNVHTQTV
jgi:hypothetical protein